MASIEKYSKSEKCCGCGACSNICPKQAITMESGDKGFLYPVVNKEKCIECGLCLRVCAFNREQGNLQTKQYAYAVKNRDDKVRMESRSGGVFTALTDQCLQNNGVIYGVALNGMFEAYHSRATNYEERDLFRGSKYIQSNVGDTYKKVKEDLSKGISVVFSGTPCQVNALKSYLGDKDYDNLILVDIICHGVPSLKVWKDYLKYYEKKCNGKVKKVDFRNKKKFGWAASKETIWINDESYDNDLFIDLFNSGLIERESCFSCPYKNLNRTGDITIGDFWGIDKIKQEFNDNKGVSLVICNTLKGYEYYKKIESDLESMEVNIDDCLQPALMHANKLPKDIKVFWKMYKMLGGIRYAKIYQYKLKIDFKINRLLKK